MVIYVDDMLHLCVMRCNCHAFEYNVTYNSITLYYIYVGVFSYNWNCTPKNCVKLDRILKTLSAALSKAAWSDGKPAVKKFHLNQAFVFSHLLEFHEMASKWIEMSVRTVVSIAS